MDPVDIGGDCKISKKLIWKPVRRASCVSLRYCLSYLSTVHTYKSDSNGGGHGRETDTYRTTYDPDTPGSLPEAVIELVSVAIGKEPKSMDPLFDVVDPDALDTLFRSREARTGRIEFRFCGCEVRAVSGGEVLVSGPVDGE